jgi:HTH-type transcriptional regulator/antitoxin HigA
VLTFEVGVDADVTLPPVDRQGSVECVHVDDLHVLAVEIGGGDGGGEPLAVVPEVISVAGKAAGDADLSADAALGQVQAHPDVELEGEHLTWLRDLPITALQLRGYLPTTNDRRELYHAALAFFGVANLAAWRRIWSRPVASFKRANTFTSHAESVASWIRIGELTAQHLHAEPFDKDGFRTALHHARTLTRTDDFLHELQGLCAAQGVLVVYVAEIDKCRISGATWWSSPTRAVIALSDRYKTEDQFWFSFFHEAGHVLLHSKKETFIDDGSESDDIEDAANRFAANTLIPPREQHHLAALTTTTEVEAFATRIDVSEGIVVGQLQHRGLWEWRKGNGLKRRFDLTPT